MYALLAMDSEGALADGPGLPRDADGRHVRCDAAVAAICVMSKVLLRLRVAGPGTADELRPRLTFAMEAMIREFVGPDIGPR